MTKREFDAATKYNEHGQRIMSASQYRRVDRCHVPAWERDRLAERKPGWAWRVAQLRRRINPDTGARL